MPFKSFSRRLDILPSMMCLFHGVISNAVLWDKDISFPTEYDIKILGSFRCVIAIVHVFFFFQKIKNHLLLIFRIYIPGWWPISLVINDLK
jgi:hypothetical protein